MKKSNFLKKLRKQGKIELVEGSEEIKSSYLEKADNCLKASKILLVNKLYENSISEAYYCMYNSLLALLFKTGIKSENHSGSIILLKKLFDNEDLFKIISFAKEERIDRQYYVTSKEESVSTQESAKDLVEKAEDFLVNIKILINKTGNEDIKKIREDFEGLFEDENEEENLQV